MVVGSVIGASMPLLWSQAQTLTVLFAIWAGLGIATAATFYDAVFAVIAYRFPESHRIKITLITLVPVLQWWPAYRGR